MQFRSGELDGLVIIDIEPHSDERGLFARTRCEREFMEQGLVGTFVQDSIGANHRAGTLRGMHFHAAPYKQVRLVRCIAGQLHMVVLDLRPRSNSYMHHTALQLTAGGYRSVYIPPGCAMGYQTMADDTVIFYQMPLFFDPAYERGFRWDDPAFGIQWPAAQRIIKERDASYPDFDPESTRQFEEYI
jgi:dTDP-4-dehydrorhamnose 3,5-epimerase